jgi:hypothetical protein
MSSKVPNAAAVLSRWELVVGLVARPSLGECSGVIRPRRVRAFMAPPKVRDLQEP